jgi:predicted DNA-binding ribbon-helix-helix protein
MGKQKEDLIITSLRVPRPLWKVIRNVAFDRNVSINSVVVEVLNEKFGKEVKAQ